MNEKYTNVLKRLYKTNKFKTKKVNLENITKAALLFGNPQNSVDYIHVTGTNGKGSVCKKIASTLEYSGYNTGIFTSPHISTFRERIQINSKYIETDYIVNNLEIIYKICDKEGIDLTYFEIVTLLSLNYFKDKNVDLAVFEVGLGGNLDATNIVNPLLSIITSIGLDHTGTLGETQEEIAREKSGIFKKNRPCLIGIDCFPKEIFKLKAEGLNSKLYCVSDSDKDSLSKYSNRSNSSLLYDDYETENKLTSSKAIEILKTHYPDKFNKVNEDTIRKGLESNQPCRKEDVFKQIGKEKVLLNISKTSKSSSTSISDNQSKSSSTNNKTTTNNSTKSNSKTTNPNKLEKIILDVGHNPHGIDKLLSLIKLQYPVHTLRIVFGTSYGKDLSDIIKVIIPYVDHLYLVSAKHTRALPFEELKEAFSKAMRHYISHPKFNISNKEEEASGDNNSSSDINNNNGDVEKTIKQAVGDCINSGEKEILVICGSFFLMNEARHTLGYEEENDPFELNEINTLRFKI